MSTYSGKSIGPGNDDLSRRRWSRPVFCFPGQEPQAIDNRILMSEPSSSRRKERESPKKWTCEKGNRSHGHVTGQRRIFVWFGVSFYFLGERELGEPNKVKR